jgi:peptidyl-prolyl cis-trans isomerase D
MLKFMRTHATSWAIKIILVLIIIVFVLWGVGSIKEREETVVVTVEHQSITTEEFERSYNSILAYYERIFGQQLPPDFLKGMDIKQQVLDQLVNAAVVQKEIDDIGLRVSDEEFKEAIKQNPNFQRGGRFDSGLYEQIVRNIGAQLLVQIHRDLMNQRFVGLVGDTAVILNEEEVKELYAVENERISLSFVKVSPEGFAKKVMVTEVELEQYYAEHKEEFRTPSQVSVLYVRFSPNAYLNEVAVSPQEVREYYDMNREQYQSPEQVRVRHILIRAGSEATPEEVDKAKQKAEKILAEARQGTNFAALARQYSDDSSSSEGGDVGYFARGEMEPAFEKTVFSLRKGEIGPVIRTSHGFHIVKVEDVQKEKRKSLGEAEGEIISLLKREKAKKLAAMNAEDAAYQAKKREDLKSYADEKGFQMRYGGPFIAGKAGYEEKISSIAFTLDAGDISSAFQDGEDHFVLEVTEKIPPLVPPLEEVRERVQEALVSSSAQGLAQSTARQLLETWKKGEGFEKVLRANGLKVGKTGFFKRSSTSPPSIGPLGANTDEIATLSREAPWPDDIIEVEGAFVVARLEGVKRVDEKEYEKENTTYRTQLNNIKTMELFKAWLTVAKQRADIEINEKLLGRYR